MDDRIPPSSPLDLTMRVYTYGVLGIGGLGVYDPALLAKVTNTIGETTGLMPNILAKLAVPTSLAAKDGTEGTNLAYFFALTIGVIYEANRSSIAFTRNGVFTKLFFSAGVAALVALGRVGSGFLVFAAYDTFFAGLSAYQLSQLPQKPKRA